MTDPIIKQLPNSIEKFGGLDKKDTDNKEYLESQERAKKNLPDQKEKINKTLYKPAPSFSKKFLENLKKLENPENITLAISKTGYNKEENQNKKDFIDKLAEKLTKLQIKESKNSNSEKNSKKIGDILNNEAIKDEGIKGAKNKIQSNSNLKPKQVEERLNNKEKNIIQSSKIFFNEDKILEYSENHKSKSINTKSLNELGENLIQGEKIVDSDLKDILGNFIIETGGENLETYVGKNYKKVNNALNNAFELQIEKVKDGKVNYRTETVKNLKEKILDDNLTNPLEKLENFKKLKNEINKSVGTISEKRKKETKSSNKEKLITKKELINKGNKINKKIKIEKNPKEKQKLQEELDQIKKLLLKKTKPGEVMGGNKLDKNSHQIEKNKRI